MNNYIDISWSKVAELLERFWLPIQLLEERISCFLKGLVYDKFVIAGAQDELFVVLYDSKYIYLLSNYDISKHPFVLRLKENAKIEFTEKNKPYFFQIYRKNETIENYIKIPSVLLTSLFYPEKYPTARYNLSLGSIAATLRYCNSAEVKLIDCQFDYNVEDIYQYVVKSKPEIIGVSANFGHYNLLLDLLKSISILNYTPVIILGNILPTINYIDLLKDYPNILICNSFGEATMLKLVEFYKSRDNFNKIPNIFYVDASGKIQKTFSYNLRLDENQVPVIDNINELIKKDGVITAEFSRGCQFSACSFCPRIHKGISWLSMSSSQMLRFWKYFNLIFKKYNLTPYVFLADEDFIGHSIKELSVFFNQIKKNTINIKFDASCRTDQIFNEQKNEAWHLDRGKFFIEANKVGLTRLFIGIESGSSKQLQRYNKGTTVNSNISAIRFLSALGMKLRLGFILFDPLLTVEELAENITFLGRNDVIFNKLKNESLNEIYNQIKETHCKSIQLETNNFVFENVSYMLSPLEVLITSNYLKKIQRKYPELIIDKDKNFGRVNLKYVDNRIEQIKEISQMWVNYCFPIIYTLKGLRKISSGKIKKRLTEIIKKHRALSYFLLRSLTDLFNLYEQLQYKYWENQIQTPKKIQPELKYAKEQFRKSPDCALNNIIQLFEQLFKESIAEFNNSIELLSEQKKKIWFDVFQTWNNTSINNSKKIRVK